ncbi:MAG: alpha/beta fold hydrolase [Pseudomonadota bacterium]
MTDHEIFRLGDVRLTSGAVLRDARLAFRSWGTRAPGGDNAVLLPTFYTGTHRRNEGFFGRGRPIDPARHFVVSINLLGNGLSSSPSNTGVPQDGPRFPHVSFQDNVSLQHRLVTALGIRRLRLVTGWSMAGCQCYHWAVQYPEMVDAILPFCGSARTSPHNRVFLEGVKAALTTDAAFAGGDYKAPPVAGLRAFARVYAGWAYSQTFFRDRLHQTLGHATYADLLRDWEEDHCQNWDANDLLAMLETWMAGDISAGVEGSFEEMLGAIQTRAILMPCRQDLYFPPEDNAIEAQFMPRAKFRPVDSPWGHCAASPGNDPTFMAALDDAFAELLVS